MNKAMFSLNFMYCMERFATAIYQIQKGGFKNKIIAEKLTYAVDNEQQHALKLRSPIIELGNTPSRYGISISDCWLPAWGLEQMCRQDAGA